ncbi:Z-ring formation inhibitor MciZ [Paenibacillus sp. A14]
MKSYFSVNMMCFQGKAWQIRILLSQWKKEAGASATVADLLHRYGCK